MAKNMKTTRMISTNYIWKWQHAREFDIKMKSTVVFFNWIWKFSIFYWHSVNGMGWSSLLLLKIVTALRALTLNRIAFWTLISLSLSLSLSLSSTYEVHVVFFSTLCKEMCMYMYLCKLLFWIWIRKEKGLKTNKSLLFLDFFILKTNYTMNSTMTEQHDVFK